MILEECDQRYGDKAKKYFKIDNVMDKILNEVNLLHKTRENHVKY